MGLTLCNTNEFVQSQFSDGFLNCTVNVVAAATADIAADVAATCGGTPRGGDRRCFCATASADVDDVVIQWQGTAWLLP